MKIKNNSRLIEMKFNFGQEVKTINPNSKVYIVSTIQIFADNVVIYGCLNESGNYTWFKDYELEATNDKPMGINLELYIKS